MVKFRGEREIIFLERGGTRINFFKEWGGEHEIFFQLSEEKKEGGEKEKNKKILRKKRVC